MVPWATVLDRFDEVMAGAYSVSLLGALSGPTVTQLWQKVRLSGSDQSAPAESNLRRALV
jgi:hypothetical protein